MTDGPRSELPYRGRDPVYNYQMGREFAYPVAMTLFETSNSKHRVNAHKTPTLSPPTREAGDERCRTVANGRADATTDQPPSKNRLDTDMTVTMAIPHTDVSP